MPDARGVVGVKRQRHRAAQEPRFSCRGSLVAMVSARCVERSGQLRQEAEGRQSTNRNLPDPGSARGGRLRRELSPGDSSMERQRTLQVGIGGQRRYCGRCSRPSLRLHGIRPNGGTIPGDSSTGIHGHPLHRLVGRLTCWRADLAVARCAAWRLLVAPAYPAFGVVVRVVAVRLAEWVPVAGLSWPRH